MVHSAISDTDFQALYYIACKRWLHWEPVDIDRDSTGDEHYEWGDDLMNDLEIRFNRLRQFNKTLNESHDKKLINVTTNTKNALKHDTIELVANQIYDKWTISLNSTRKRLGIQNQNRVHK